jgi:hypothetical protein
MRMFSRNLALAVLTIASGLFFGQIAKADGVEPGYKDIRPSYRHQNSSSDLREYLTAEDKRILKRIHAKASARRDGRVARKSRPVERIYVAQPRRPRYVETVRYERDTRECRAAISVEVRPRGTYGRASESAYNAWENSARARHGYAFGNRSNARGAEPDCNPVRKTFIGTKVWVCSFVARPCRDL